MVGVWEAEFLRAPAAPKKLALLYLANDILQNSRKKGPEYVQEFFRALPRPLQQLLKHGDGKARPRGHAGRARRPSAGRAKAGAGARRGVARHTAAPLLQTRGLAATPQVACVLSPGASRRGTCGRRGSWLTGAGHTLQTGRAARPRRRARRWSGWWRSGRSGACLARRARSRSRRSSRRRRRRASRTPWVRAGLRAGLLAWAARRAPLRSSFADIACAKGRR